MGSTRCDADAGWVPEKASLAARSLIGRAGITADLNPGGSIFLGTGTLSWRPWSQSFGLADYVEHRGVCPMPPLPGPSQYQFSASRGSVASVALREPVGRAGMGRNLLLEMPPPGWQWQDGGNMKEETMNSFLPCFDNGRALGLINPHCCLWSFGLGVTVTRLRRTWLICTPFTSS